MKIKTNIHKVAGVLLTFLVSAPHVANTMESSDSLTDLSSKHEALQELSVESHKSEEEQDLSEQLRNQGYYRQELQKLEESTKRVHKEVDRILGKFRHNMEEYRKRTRGTGIEITASYTAKPQYAEAKSEDDKLQDYDYSNFKISCRQTVGGLPIRSEPINIVGVPERSYDIEGVKFKRQNVSGKGNNCFFNSVGLTRTKAVERLKAKRNDPIVRYIIANGIRCLQTELTPHLKSILERVPKDPDYHSDDHIQENYLRNTHLRIRYIATSLEAFDTFINEHIAGSKMINFNPRMPEDDEDDDEEAQELNRHYREQMVNNPEIYYYPVDAIAYINNFGIRAYTPVTKGASKLYLLHQFIPKEATKIAYVYYEDHHAQALIPQG